MFHRAEVGLMPRPPEILTANMNSWSKESPQPLSHTNCRQIHFQSFLSSICLSTLSSKPLVASIGAIPETCHSKLSRRGQVGEGRLQ